MPSSDTNAMVQPMQPTEMQTYAPKPPGSSSPSFLNNGNIANIPVSSVVGGMTIAGSNYGMSQIGGTEVVALAAFLNLIAQFVKLPDRFDHNRWIIPILLIVGFVAAYFVFHDHIKAFLDGALASLQAIINYRSYRNIGLGGFPPATYNGRT